MNKELKALDYLMKGDYEKSAFDLPEYELVRKALTPPTAEEVCKAMSEYLGEEVRYCCGKYCNVFYRVYLGTELVELFDGEVRFCSSDATFYLTPSLIKMAVDFFNSSEEKK